MYQTDQATASSTLPAPAAAGTQGFFTNGNPASGVAATIVDADWLNMIQQELISIVAAAGITPSKTTYNQVLSAIKRIGQSTVVLADTGAVNAYSATNAVPLVAGTWVNGVVQQIAVAHTNNGASTYAPDGLAPIPIYGLGLQPLQQGEMFAGGTAILMKQTIAGVNGGNPICVLLECAGGAQQIAPATASQHAVQLGQVSGVVGSVRNLSMSVTAASAQATLTADEIIVETALGGLRYCLANFNKTINLATTGAGGMDTGSAPTSGYVALYAIYNPTTATAALLATNATSSVAPNVYGAGHMPSGYTASALVSVWPTNASGQFKVANQRDRKISFAQIGVLSISTNQATITSLSISGAVPPNAVSVSGILQENSNASATLNVQVASDANAADVQQVNGSALIQVAGSFRDLMLMTTQTLWYVATASTGTPSGSINVSNYTF